MRLTTITRSSTYNLVTLERVRLGLLGSAADTSQDALLQELIKGASSAMAEYLGWPVARQQYRLQLAGAGGTRLCLPPSHCIVPLDPESLAATIDGGAVTDFTLLDDGELYRAAGWTRSSDVDAPLNVVLAWLAGWVLPDQLQEWGSWADADDPPALTVGQWLKPSSPALSPLLFEVTTAGNPPDATPEPTWPTTPGTEVALGGTAVATARTAEEWPAGYADYAYLEVHRRWVDLPPGVASMMMGGHQVQFFATQTAGVLAPVVREWLDGLKLVVA